MEMLKLDVGGYKGRLGFVDIRSGVGWVANLFFVKKIFYIVLFLLNLLNNFFEFLFNLLDILIFR